MYRFKSYYISINNLKIRYYQGGQGDPLLIIHGGNSHARLLAMNMRELCKNYTVYIPDLPGFGMSQAMKGNYYVPEFIEFINKFASILGLQSFNLMGHSLGGAVATGYALTYPNQVKRLVVIDSMCYGEDIALWVRVLTASPFSFSFGKALVSLLKGIKWIAEAMFRSMEFILPISEASLIIGISAANLQSQSVVLFHQLSEIVAPTLVVWGERDPIVPVKQAYAAATVIPDCQLVVLKGGHSAYARRPEFSVELNRFLSER